MRDGSKCALAASRPSRDSASWSTRACTAAPRSARIRGVTMGGARKAEREDSLISSVCVYLVYANNLTHSYMYGAVGFVVAAAIGYGVSRLIPGGDSDEVG